jgi:hypothetical protein
MKPVSFWELNLTGLRDLSGLKSNPSGLKNNLPDRNILQMKPVFFLGLNLTGF